MIVANQTKNFNISAKQLSISGDNIKKGSAQMSYDQLNTI